MERERACRREGSAERACGRAAAAAGTGGGPPPQRAAHEQMRARRVWHLLVGAAPRRSSLSRPRAKPAFVPHGWRLVVKTTPALMLLVENLNAGGHTELTAQSSLVAQEHANLTRIPNWPGRELGFQVGCSSARDEGRVAGDL